MEIRLLTKEDRFDAGVVSHIAFHSRCDDIETKREGWENGKDEDWGAFDTDGTLMARIVNNRFRANFDGHSVECGGIGAVSTLPEYRESGAIRAIFARLLPYARKNGEVLSALYPFSHAFYRKFGYETVIYKNVYTFDPSALSGHHHKGWTKQWKPGDDVSEYTRIYAQWAAKYGLAIARDDNQMTAQHVNGLFYKDRRFAYLLGDADGAKAYVVLQDVFRPESAKMDVREAAWLGADGFEAVLGFLSRFTADYGQIALPLPTDMDLRLYVRDPYAVKAEPLCDYMVRVMDTAQVLAFLKKPEDARFVIRVDGDEQIAENNGTWAVCGDSAVPTAEEPDLELSCRALGQMAVGACGLYEAELRGDVTVYAKRDTLEKVFVRKGIYVGDHF